MPPRVDPSTSSGLQRLSRHILRVVKRYHEREGNSASWSSVDELAAADDLRYQERHEEIVQELIESLIEDASPLETHTDDNSSASDESTRITLTHPVRVSAYITLLKRNRTDPIEQTN